MKTQKHYFNYKTKKTLSQTNGAINKVINKSVENK